MPSAVVFHPLHNIVLNVGAHGDRNDVLIIEEGKSVSQTAIALRNGVKIARRSQLETHFNAVVSSRADKNGLTRNPINCSHRAVVSPSDDMQ